jgi:hypothetical protein
MNLDRLPQIGDQFCSGSLVNTVTGIFATFTENFQPTVKIVLDHPLGGELHIPYTDWVKALDRGLLTKEHA